MRTTLTARMFRTIPIIHLRIREAQDHSAETVEVAIAAVRTAAEVSAETAEAVHTAAAVSAEAAEAVHIAVAVSAEEAVAATAAVQAAVVVEDVASADVVKIRTSAFIIRCTSRIGHWA